MAACQVHLFPNSSKFREIPPSLSLQHTVCLLSSPDPTKASSDLLPAQLLPPWHKAALGCRIKWDWMEFPRLCRASPRGFFPCHNLLLQQQIVNGLAVGSRNEIGFPMEKQLCSRSPRSHFSRSLRLPATQGTLGEPQPGGSCQR